jgi:hypothetical protein
MNVDKVIEAYRDAEEEEQICLFLAYPDLRQMFTGIDAERAARETSRKKAVTG